MFKSLKILSCLQLTEFRDHKLVRSKKGNDGAEYLVIPIERSALASFVETIQEKM